MDRTFFDYIRLTGRRRLQPILGCCLLACVLVVVMVRSAETQYMAQVDVIVSMAPASILPGPASLGPLGAMASIERETFIASQELIVRSRSLFARVEAAMSADGASVQPKAPSSAAKLVQAVQTVLFGVDYVETQARFRDVEYARYLKNVIFTPQFDTGSFNISYRDTDPVVAIRKTAAVADALIQINADQLREQSAKSSEFLGRKVSEAAKTVEESSEDLADFMKRNRYINSENITEAKYRQYIEAEQSHRKALAELRTKERLLKDSERLKQSIESELRNVLNSGGNARIEALLVEITRFETGLLKAEGSDASGQQVPFLTKKLHGLRQQLTAEVGSHESLLDGENLREILREVRQKTVELTSEIEATRGMVHSLTAQMTSAAAEIEQYPELNARFARKMASHLQKAKILEILSENYQKVMIQSDAKPSTLLMIDQPMISSSVLSSGKLRILISGFGVTAVFIVLLFAAFDFARGSILTLSHLAEIQGEAVLGYFPHVGRRATKALLASGRNVQVQRLCHMIDHRLSKQLPSTSKVILMSSATSGSGKSTSAVGIAAGLAGGDRRVLVIDCDFRARKRGVRHFLRTPTAAADAQLWSIQRQHADIIKSSAEARRTPVFATLDDSAHDELELTSFLRKAFQVQVAEYRAAFDYIVLDGPPLSFAEGLCLVPLADSVLVCCMQGKATENDAASSLGLVEQYKSDQASVLLLLTDAHVDVSSGSTLNYRRPGSNYPRAA